MHAPIQSRPYGRLKPSESTDHPFRHFLADDVLPAPVAAVLLDWFETDAPWRLVETDFYEQFEFDLRDATLPAAAAGLTMDAALGDLRKTMEAFFDTRLADDVHVVAHRLQDGQRIGLHNDLREGGETHRLTIQLNRGLTDEDGGFFMLFNSDQADDVHRILRPISGSAIGFAIGPTSHHAVSRVHGGVRYTLVYSFREARGG